MSSEDIKMLEFTQTQKSDTASHIVYADFESLIKIVDRCKNNPGNVSTTKLGENFPRGYSMSTI